jgi:hypothetical protein
VSEWQPIERGTRVISCTFDCSATAIHSYCIMGKLNHNVRLALWFTFASTVSHSLPSFPHFIHSCECPFVHHSAVHVHCCYLATFDILVTPRPWPKHENNSTCTRLDYRPPSTHSDGASAVPTHHLTVAHTCYHDDTAHDCLQAARQIWAFVTLSLYLKSLTGTNFSVGVSEGVQGGLQAGTALLVGIYVDKSRRDKGMRIAGCLGLLAIGEGVNTRAHSCARTHTHTHTHTHT